MPTGRRRCSAQVVNVNGFKLLLDCAEGTQDRIRQHHLKLQSLGTVLISHLHGDHFFGLAPLLSTMHLCGRTEPMTIVAPKGAKEVIETTFALTGNHVGYELNFIEMDFSEGLHRVFEGKRCTVDAFPILHSVPTYGFRITEVPRSSNTPRVYTYACDTAYSEDLVPFMRLARERQHLTAGQAARLATLAEPKQLMLTHISARYKEPELLTDQATALFPSTILATDGQIVEIK